MLNIKLLINAEWNELEKNKLLNLVKDKLGNEMIINLEYVDVFNTDSSGKFRWIISKVSPFVKGVV